MKRLRDIVDFITVILGLIAPFGFFVVVSYLLFGATPTDWLSAIGLLCLYVMYKADRIVDRDRGGHELPAPPVASQPAKEED